MYKHIFFKEPSAGKYRAKADILLMLHYLWVVDAHDASMLMYCCPEDFASLVQGRL